MLRNRSQTLLGLLERVWFKQFDSLLVLELENHSINKEGYLYTNFENKQFQIATDGEIRTCNPHPLIDDKHYQVFENEMTYHAITDNKKAIDYFHATYCLVELLLHGAKLEIIYPYLEDRFNIIFSVETKTLLKKY